VAAHRAPEATVAPKTNGLFTARQAAVVEALRRGKANKIIAYELKMRESTVKVHVRNIMKKLHATNRTEVAFMANRLLNGEELAG
jgi:DNA-binding NarL/FixJ family response regulator